MVKETLQKITERLADTAPHWIVMLMLTGFFLVYLERSDIRESQAVERDDLISKQRIETCHDVQERSIVVMDRIGQTLEKHNNSLDVLADEMQKIGTMLKMIERK